MFSRRSLLVGSAALGSRFVPRVVGAGAALWPIGAAAIEPATVATVVGVCVSIAKALKTGPGVGDLLQMQMAQLQMISAQIQNVRKALDVVIEKLEELKEIVTQVPAQVVINLYSNEIRAASQLLEEILVTFGVDRDEHGIDYANQANSRELEDILNRSRRSRNIMVERNELTVPIVALALELEVNAMSMLGVRDARYRTAIDAYRQWFDQMLQGGGDSLIEKKKKALEDFLARYGDLQTLREEIDQKTCFEGGGAFHPRGNFVWIRGVVKTVQVKDEDDPYRSHRVTSVSSMEEFMVELPEEIKKQFMLYYDFREARAEDVVDYRDVRADMRVELRKHLEAVPEAPIRGLGLSYKCDPQLVRPLGRFLEQRTPAMNAAITAANRLIALEGFRLVANQALDRCKRQLQ